MPAKGQPPPQPGASTAGPAPRGRPDTLSRGRLRLPRLPLHLPGVYTEDPASLACPEMAAAGRVLSALPLAAVPRPPLAASVRANSNRASVSHLRRQLYGRLYPVLLVKTDGSTVRLRYGEPKRILMLPLDSSALPEAERKARLGSAGRLMLSKEDKEAAKMGLSVFTHQKVSSSPETSGSKKKQEKEEKVEEKRHHRRKTQQRPETSRHGGRRRHDTDSSASSRDSGRSPSRRPARRRSRSRDGRGRHPSPRRKGRKRSRSRSPPSRGVRQRHDTDSDD
ncbi:PREDICTED: serine/arginine repetitive matrix protein 2-like [Nipponia nippon]|uniref:serine/arginine repetitive matrix protein 2-like n=1 Tax=Nipponia nippon TaxID=128390 RepID=UPI000510E798|nr:PREDICTED: serine/arginine repetitive matrix protein 2-like [Nipponia nippon]